MEPDSEALRKQLEDATRRLVAEEKAKKRDGKIHSENVKAIKEEIDEIMEQLDGDV